jgi:hypothetical protein
VKCKEKATDLIFDATLYGEDAVMVRCSSPESFPFYIISLDVFVDRFEELCIPVR